MAEVEHNYAARILKLLGSSNYTFHSNILMQWLGSDPFEEIGYFYLAQLISSIVIELSSIVGKTWVMNW